MWSDVYNASGLEQEWHLLYLSCGRFVRDLITCRIQDLYAMEGEAQLEEAKFHSHSSK